MKDLPSYNKCECESTGMLLSTVSKYITLLEQNKCKACIIM